MTCLTNYSLNLNCLVGVALLPFVDEKRLLAALSHVYPDLTELESKFVVVNKFCSNLKRTLCILCFPAINAPLNKLFGAWVLSYHC